MADQEIEKFQKKLTPQSRHSFQTLVESLSPQEKNNLLQLLRGLPSETQLFRMLLRLSTNHLRLAFGEKHRVAIIGPANVGKSTLFNQLISDRKEQAEVSALPGTTRKNQAADSGLFMLIDTPGADAVGEVGEQERAAALSAAVEADVLLLMFDAVQGIKKTELELYEQVVHLKKPLVILMNKIDLVRREKDKVVALAARNLGIEPDQILPISARAGDQLAQVLMSIAVVEPSLVAALGSALPEYRWHLAWRSIISGASVSAVIALTPLPMLDFGPLLVTQSLMVLGIARIYQYEITPARAKELIATFGLGFLGRTLFQQLSKLGGIPGWALSAAVAASTTVVMGYAAAIWFESGEKVSGETLKALTKRITLYLVDALGKIAKKPGQQSLQQKIQASLETMPDLRQTAANPREIKLN